MLSLPTRERGLKSVSESTVLHFIMVAPYAGAWIEIKDQLTELYSQLSLPTRERGLKSTIGDGVHTYNSRSLRGSVD